MERIRILGMGILLGLFGPAIDACAADAPISKWYEVKDKQVFIHLHVFYSSTCAHCTKAHAFLADLQKRQAWLKVTSYEVSGTPANMDLYRKTAESINRTAGQVPAFFFCKQLEIGFVSNESTGKRLERALERCHDLLQQKLDETPKTDAPKILRFVDGPDDLLPDLDAELDKELSRPEDDTVEVPGYGEINTSEYSLPVLTLVLGGLDAFNPCAFFVLMILLSLMLHSGSRKRMMLVGLVFVVISGLVYFMFMAAWLNLFFMVGHLRIITLVAGLVAVIASLINIKDFFWFKVGVSLSLPESVKPGLFRRMNALVANGSVLGVLTGTAVLAVATNLYELLCTSGLPLVFTRILTLREMSQTSYYGYLALYNLVYVTPLLMIVLAFALTLSARKLTEYQGRLLKLLSGMMMLALGLLLLIRPATLNTLSGAVFTLLIAIGGTIAIAAVHRIATGRPRPHLPLGLRAKASRE